MLLKVMQVLIMLKLMAYFPFFVLGKLSLEKAPLNLGSYLKY